MKSSGPLVGLESTPISSAPSARRASPSLTSARNSSASSSICDLLLAQPALLIGKRAADERFDVVGRQRLEFEHAAAADQRAVEREERILRGRADKDHDAFFDVGQEHVLLGAVEAMDFVDEQQRALAGGGEQIAGLVENFAEFFDAAGDGADLPEVAAAGGGQQMGERRFAGAGRAVEDDRAEPVGGQQAAEQFAFAEKMLLADELVERLRPHPRGQRLSLAAVFGFGSAKRDMTESVRVKWKTEIELRRLMSHSECEHKTK